MARYFISCVVLVVLYLATQHVVHHYTNDFDESIPFVNKIEQNHESYTSADIITFGSSIEYMSHPKEVDKQSITKYLKELLPKQKIVPLSQAAYTIEILGSLMKYFHSNTSRDHVYVIEMNLDQFSINDNKMFVDRTRERLAYQDGLLSVLYKPLSVFNYKFGVYSTKAFENQKVYLDGEYKGTKAELDNLDNYSYAEVCRHRYMIQYLYDLNDSHEKIVYLRKLIDYINKEQLSVLFYITPFDYSSCQTYFDVEICDSVIDSNVTVITDLFESKKMHYIDLSRKLKSEHIASSAATPNGHLKASGRLYVAKRIAMYIKNNMAEIQHK